MPSDHKPAPVSDKPISDEVLREYVAPPETSRTWCGERLAEVSAELLAAREALRELLACESCSTVMEKTHYGWATKARSLLPTASGG